jgi:hypothetical protein
MLLGTILAYLSGLALVAPGLDPQVAIGTAVALNICDAIMCRLIAHNNGYPRNAWTVAGLIGGVWAVAVVILLPRRDGGGTPRPLA